VRRRRKGEFANQANQARVPLGEIKTGAGWEVPAGRGDFEVSVPGQRMEGGPSSASARDRGDLALTQLASMHRSGRVNYEQPRLSSEGSSLRRISGNCRWLPQARSF
jgi:hypothetical protein